jgi:FKBP-type peptidyl-prolyl cis-trans isomerase FklB
MMTRTVLAVLLTLTLVSTACAQETASESDTTLDSMTDKVSYSIGLNLGRSLSSQEVEVDMDVLARGIRDGMGDAEALMTDEEIQQTMTDFQQEMVAKQQAKREEMATQNKTEGESFLAENKAKDGVMTTDSGLQYMVMEEGDGPKPAPTDQVTVHYKGTLLDGTVFDSSYDRGQPATFPLNAVIPGWTEGVQLMSVGSKYKFWIPAELGYGPNGQGPVIGPNATLVFEVELLDIVDQGGTEAPAAGTEGDGR